MKRRRRGVARTAVWVAASVVAAAGIGATARLLESNEASAPEPGPVHVHALGVNPADGALFIATHTGLFRLGADEKRAQRVGDRHQDTMGFTVVGADHFVGSGHPDLRDELPPLLGLIESQDAGKTWTSISLLGEADFHALRASGGRVIGYDATGGRVLISDDGGRNWASGRPPEPLVDLIADPTSAERLLAAGESRLFISSNGGKTWNEREQGTGLLAWPQRDRLYLLDAGGRLWLSLDGGKRWQGRGEIGGRAAAILAVDAHSLFAATHVGEIKHSRDGGMTWTTRSAP
jgi:hypothetical protein